MSDPADPPLDEAQQGPLSAFLEAVGLRPRRTVTAAEPGSAGADLMDHARAFQSLTVADVMIPRADIKGVELSSSLEALIAAFAESEHSRLPVYRESLDDPVGVAHLKDVFLLIAEPSLRAKADGAVLRRLKRETLYVPPSMRAADLLVRMQASRIHMAMVIDEFGGVDGLVTLEDVLEAVVGEIDDEHDEAQIAQITARPGGIFEVDGRTPLEDLEAALGQRLFTDDMDDEAIDTAAGVVTALAGRLPQRGEIIAHPAGFDFEVTDADPRRIKRLRVRPAAAGPDG
ncbi:MAG TPA: hemolysin family protein [Caulobacteraceae bacterium]|jgi:CBS domain containing-hemolysin-like protein|nr:hemolysin family protein [Caulobacteraceae bacterium]